MPRAVWLRKMKDNFSCRGQQTLLQLLSTNSMSILSSAHISLTVVEQTVSKIMGGEMSRRSITLSESLAKDMHVSISCLYIYPGYLHICRGSTLQVSPDIAPSP